MAEQNAEGIVAEQNAEVIVAEQNAEGIVAEQNAEGIDVHVEVAIGNVNVDVKVIGREVSEEMTSNDVDAFSKSLRAAPLSISILGNLTLLASKKDFSIEKEGMIFEHLKYPESFRACLTQTSNMGHLAFMRADKGMTSIALLTKQIPGLVEEVKEILLEGEDDDFDSIPINLEAIKKIMSECKDESAAVVEKFESVYGALNELQENSVRRSGEADNTLTDLEKDEKANEHENEKILAEIERLDKEESSLHDEIAKTDQNMQKARDDVFRQQEEINKKTEALRLMYEKSKSYFNLMDKNKDVDDRSWIKKIWGGHDSHLKAKAEEVEKLRAAMSVDRANLQDSEQALKDSKDQYNKHIESLHKARGELQKQTFEIKQRERETLNRKYELMTQLSKIKMETMTEEQSREVLVQGLKAFGELKDQWEKLTTYFTRVSTLINIALAKPEEMFREKAILALDKRQKGKKLTSVTKKHLVKPAEEAIHVSLVINQMSSMYVALSSGHLLPMLSNLGKGLHLKPEIERDAKEIAKLQALILERANKADGFVSGQVQAFEVLGFMKDLSITAEEKEN